MPAIVGSQATGVLHDFRDLLPITDNTPMISLGEGSTPLVRSVRLEGEVGCEALYFKLESCNPSGSFKDRGMVVAVAKAIEAGDTAVLCASTGKKVGRSRGRGEDHRDLSTMRPDPVPVPLLVAAPLSRYDAS